MNTFLRKTRYLFFINLVFLIGVRSSYVLSPVVSTDTGLLQGHLVKVNNANDDVYEFSGIPYAEPPIDKRNVKRRFAKTVPKTRWPGTYMATNVPAECPQPPVSDPAEFLFTQTVDSSEDCLFLNIWVPKKHLDAHDNNPKPEPLPVLFFIHGGGFTSGATSRILFNGTVIAAKQNIIFVTIQYRLGALGFAYLGTREVPGNMGLWDQFEALKWVYQNIVFFGGDRDAITIAGQSAGAASVAFHLLSPYSRPLINKAIMQSGSPLCTWASMTKEEAYARTTRLVDLIANVSTEWHEPCTQASKLPPRAKLECLRKPMPSFFVENQLSVFELDKKTQSPSITDLPWVPVVDGDFIPRDPVLMAAAGDFAKVPLITGHNMDEGSFLLQTSAIGFTHFSQTETPETSFANLTHEDFREMINSYYTFYPSNGQPADPIVKEAIELQYWISGDGMSQKPLHGRKVADQIKKMLGDSALTCPSISWADAVAKYEPVYQYMFNYMPSSCPTPQWYGVAHTYELPFVYGDALNENEPLSMIGNYSHEDKLLSKRVLQYWTNFVKTGNPNDADSSLKNELPLPNWPHYKPVSGDTLELSGDGSKGNLIEALKSRDCKFWSKELPEMNARLQRAATLQVSSVRHPMNSAKSITSPYLSLILPGIINFILVKKIDFIIKLH